jgi:putative ABC transport system permease protein
VVLYNLTNVNVTERLREIATIKVLGFFDREVSAYVDRESSILTILGMLIGLVMGIFLHRYIIVTAEVEYVMFGRNISLMSYIYSAILTLVFSSMVNIVMHFRLKKINMVESLKSVD